MLRSAKTSFRATRVGAAVAIALLAGAQGCKRDNAQLSKPLASSLIFDNASPEAREALASQVDFRLTDANFVQWEDAQAQLERLPRSVIPLTTAVGGSAIDRAVARLESSPRARSAIESSGLSVRDFVLATIALAQATEATETGKSTSVAAVPAENVQFVQRYRSRILRAQAQARIDRQQGEQVDFQLNSDSNLQLTPVVLIAPTITYTGNRIPHPSSRRGPAHRRDATPRATQCATRFRW